MSHLVLCGAYLQGAWKRPGAGAGREEAAAWLKLVELGWGRENSAFRQVFANQFIPDATAEQLAAFDEIQRTTVSGEAAAALLRTFYDIDVVAAARQVRSPTLVLHATADARIPHMNHIFSKLGVGERSQLIVLARDAGFGKGAHA